MWPISTSDRACRRFAAAGLALLLAAFGGAGPAAAQQPLEAQSSAAVDALRERARGGEAEAQYELGMALMARTTIARSRRRAAGCAKRCEPAMSKRKMALRGCC
jgi:hypothetical protein